MASAVASKVASKVASAVASEVASRFEDTAKHQNKIDKYVSKNLFVVLIQYGENCQLITLKLDFV